MHKTQKQVRINNPYAIFTACTLLILVLFTLLSPKFSAITLPFKSQATLKSFAQSVNEDKSINAQKFWEFREFYSPGSFIFSSHGLPNNKTSHAKTLISIPLNFTTLTPFSVFRSPKVTSIDFYTTANSLQDIMQTSPSGKIIFQDTNTIMHEAENGEIKIVFIKPYKEIKKTIGFFSIHEDDNNIIKDKNWVNITSIKTD